MDYYQGYEDAMRQTKVTRGHGLIGFLFRSIFSILYGVFVYVPLLMLGYLLANRISIYYSNDIVIKCGLTLAFTYVLFATIYFLKGIVIGMKHNSHHWWVALWLICVAITCGIQTILAQSLFGDYLAARNIMNHRLWSWIAAAVVGTLIYSHYQFLSNVAPRSVFWIYRLGFKVSRRVNVNGEMSMPQKSRSFFENAPMKVSFKR